MPPINIRLELFKRAVKHDVDLTAVVNTYVEEYLDKMDQKG